MIGPRPAPAERAWPQVERLLADLRVRLGQECGRAFPRYLQLSAAESQGFAACRNERRSRRLRFEQTRPVAELLLRALRGNERAGGDVARLGMRRGVLGGPEAGLASAAGRGLRQGRGAGAGRREVLNNRGLVESAAAGTRSAGPGPVSEQAAGGRDPASARIAKPNSSVGPPSARSSPSFRSAVPTKIDPAPGPPGSTTQESPPRLLGDRASARIDRLSPRRSWPSGSCVPERARPTICRRPRRNEPGCRLTHLAGGGIWFVRACGGPPSRISFGCGFRNVTSLVGAVHGVSDSPWATTVPAQPYGKNAVVFLVLLGAGFPAVRDRGRWRGADAQADRLLPRPVV
jgi:hypothetical protein